MSDRPLPYAAMARPTAMWICVFGMAYELLLRPLLPWALALSLGDIPALPSLNDAVWAAVSGALGLGALRSYDKTQGTDLRTGQ